jgi:hypothetical protein
LIEKGESRREIIILLSPFLIAKIKKNYGTIGWKLLHKKNLFSHQNAVLDTNEL